MHNTPRIRIKLQQQPLARCGEHEQAQAQVLEQLTKQPSVKVINLQKRKKQWENLLEEQELLLVEGVGEVPPLLQCVRV